MTVLIAGSGGQLGRALLQTAPSHLSVLTRTHAELDVGDEHAVTLYVRSHRPDVIINTAAYTAVDRAETELALAQRANAQGPLHLAVAAQETGARLIHVSTDFVFDGRASVPYKPQATTHPLGVYGATKRRGELAVLNTLAERCVVLRTAWLYAATGHNFVRTMVRQMRDTARVRVVADQIGSPTSAPSLAHAIWRLVEAPNIAGVHHWTDAGVASWYDFAIAVAEEGATLRLVPQGVHVTPIATHEYPTAARRPSYSVLDTSSLRLLDVVPVHWRAQLRAVLKDLKDG